MPSEGTIGRGGQVSHRRLRDACRCTSPSGSRSSWCQGELGTQACVECHLQCKGDRQPFWGNNLDELELR